MESLLSKLRKSDIRTDPFPHIIVENVFDESLCLQLFSEFPSLETITQGNTYGSNQRFSFSAKDVLKGNSVSKLWKSFIERHVSNDFLEEFVDLFGEHIRKEHPSFEQKVEKLRELKCGIRKIDTFTDKDVLLDAQICINTPVSGNPSSVRGPHIDDPRKFLTGLFYLRHPDDDSSGGDLELYKLKNNHPKFRGQDAKISQIEDVTTVKYERNVFVLFVNSLRAVHAVSIRSHTTWPRYLVNLVGEVKEPLVDMGKHRENIALRALRRYRLLGYSPSNF